jgi:ribosomal protein L29
MHMTIKELRSKNAAELQKDLATLQELKNTREIGIVRKDIARILTLLGQHAAVEDAK